ncbi:helix-turn-helix transcriptional regulator [Solwaraspora sp. WMMA2080]|uniref:helix-turn-helix domain-containing protein n=1 Tax=unclassified Solwaraspora TaxID=2627926 RepID=UPI00248CC4B3|nr:MULTISPECIES: helix-turn-helix transcriptional regulator [unclassified Solwaraspora]WBB98618.1 helix-turn-helix transcriptional regulator [Solwaraspora sp. WMMA2059]WBC22830.1 helix-turn-helix transcriptional regulator [Solwaraspora sp. WMMA2080]
MPGDPGSGESPAAARRRLRLALRRARESAGLTQGKVADALDWSVSKVNRIEKGSVSVSTTDLRALLELYGVVDADRAVRLLRDARTSRLRGWWDEPRYREHLTPAMLQLLQLEGEASAIRVFQPTLIPGLLQTREYGEFVLNFWRSELPEADRALRLEARLRRRDQVLDRPDPPEFHLVLDESVLWRTIGGPRVMVGQFAALLRVARRPNVRVRIVPFADAAIMAMLAPFTLLDFGDEENALLYREGILLDEIVHAAQRIGRHRDYFAHIWDSAHDEATSARLITERTATLSADLPVAEAPSVGG